jgi:sugar lactone lactonase YvrE
VLHLVEDDVYLVSNINGSPFAADGNGFISRLGPDGSVVELKWIDGSTDGVTLNAPKGMGVSAGTLYVTDVDHVRMFDAKTGAAKGEVKLDGSTFLNDVAVASDGTVFVSDSGFSDGFKPSGSDAIYKLNAEGGATKIIAGEALGHPNGLLAKESGDLVVVTFGSGEVYTVSGGSSAERGAGVKTEQGSLDGIIALGSGEVLVSSWGASAVYRGKEAGPFTTVVSEVDAPADIGWDAKRSRVLIPLFKTNTVVIQEIK